MEITEEQRRRAEANRLAALAKLNRPTETRKRDAWSLFRCQKVLNQKPESSAPETILKTERPISDRFSVVLEICAPDAFSISVEPVAGFPFPGKAECLQKMNDFISTVVPFCSERQIFGKTSIYMLKDYEAVLKCLKKLSGIQLQEIPWKTLAVVQKFSHSYISNRWIACMPSHLSDNEVDELIEGLPWTLRNALLPFQLDGVRFGLRRGGCCLLADEMGLGKTIQAIAMASCFMKEGPVLVVCPAVLRFSWAEELERWLPSCLPTEIHLVFGHQDNLIYLAKCPKVVVISYRMLHHLRKSMLEREWALMIVDESHNVRCTKKSLESDEVQSVIDMASKVRRIVLLSGTPSLSRPYDIFHQINMLWPGLLGKDKYEFANNYCSVKFARGSQGKFFKDFSNGIRLEELNVLLKQTVMIRRLKENVLVQLPPKRRQVIRLKLKGHDIKNAKSSCQGDKINMENEHKRRPLNCCSYQSDGDGDGEIGIVSESNGNSRYARQLSYQELGIAKLPGFCEWLSNHSFCTEPEGVKSLDTSVSSQKMVIFAHHLKVLDGVQEFACEKGIEFVRIDGSTLSRDRQAAVQAFRSSTEVKIAIIGITAGGVGLDFSSAKNVAFVELPKSVSEMLQAEDRAHRRGQTNAVNVYIFCAKDTSDESHWQQLNRSLYRVSSMMNGEEDALSEIKVDRVCNLSQFTNLESSETGFSVQTETERNSTSLKDKLQSEVNMANDPATAGDCTPGEPFVVRNKKFLDDITYEPSHLNVELAISQQEVSKVEGDDMCTLVSNKDQYGATVVIDTDAISSPHRDSDSKPSSSQISQLLVPEMSSTCRVDNEIDKNGFIENNSFSYEEPNITEKTVARLHDDKDVKGRAAEVIHANSNCSTSVQAEPLRFEVSEYTGRVHLYVCVPGKDLRPRPMLENFRPEDLDSTVVSTTFVNKEIAPKGPKLIKENPAYRNVLLTFIKEWNNLRPIERNKLFGKPLQLPLELELCYLKENINHGSEGLLKGGSKRRVTPLVDICSPLPANAVWRKISLLCGSTKKAKEYSQAWTIADEPLCKLCQMPCSGKLAKIPEFFEDLFCNLGCFEEYRIRSSQFFLRQALFRIEHGVCTQCKLDCHKLVEYLRPLSVGRRREHIQKVAPKMANSKNLLEKLIYEPKEGNAWHADHIVPVYKGGGECRLENMRTLCVVCHSEVTAAQRTERRLLRVKAKEQLEVVMKEFKEGGTKEKMKETYSNVEDQTCFEMGERNADDDLLISVPGSAYSRDSGDKITDSD